MNRPKRARQTFSRHFSKSNADFGIYIETDGCVIISATGRVTAVDGFPAEYHDSDMVRLIAHEADLRGEIDHFADEIKQLLEGETR